MNQQKIGSFLKQLRKEKEITQEQAAEHFCVAIRTISRWETGSNMPDLGMLLSIAEFYNVKVEEILDGQRLVTCEENIHEVIGKVGEYMSMREEIRLFIKDMIMTALMLTMAIICFIKDMDTSPLTVLLLASSGTNMLLGNYKTKVAKIIGSLLLVLMIPLFIIFIFNF